MMILLALLETLGIASIMPFLAVLGDPEIIERQRLLSWFYEFGGFNSVDTFVFALGVGSFIIVVMSSLVRVLNTYAMHRFTQMRRYSIAARLLQAYLRQPYEFFLNRNSADLSKSILSEVDAVVGKVLKPAMDMISYGLICLVMVGLLVVIDPWLAVVVTAVVGAAYGGIYMGVRGLLERTGGDRVKANRERFTTASEAFGGIKDLKVLGREHIYIDRFRGPAVRYAVHQATSSTLAAVPKFLIEAVAYGGMLVLVLILMRTRGDIGTVLPVLALYAFAGYRLLPAAQHLFASASALRFGLPAVDPVYRDLALDSDKSSRSRTAPRLELKVGIRFDAVDFMYPGASRQALSAFSVHIPARRTVGLVGRTGAGKTTAVDLLLGLLSPTSGSIYIDSAPLSSANLRNWQRSIGYVPQSIYLADLSVSENIAFGIASQEIDIEAVERAARIANIHDFITEELPLGYATEIGERGVRLSGGQRQRIGIARALYHDPSLIVLDEATSALDTATERAIMDAVYRLSGEKTIVIIAHRMTTVRSCDSIIVLQEGRIADAGRFDELQLSSEEFRRLAVA
ncbi:MAG: ABC transporter ATP-binding protein [Haliea sp.]